MAWPILYRHTKRRPSDLINYAFAIVKLSLSSFRLFFGPSWTTFSRKYYPETLALLSCTKCIGSICGNASVPFSGRKGRGVWISKDFFTLFWGWQFLPLRHLYHCSRNTRIQFFLNTPPIFMAIWRLIKDWIDPVPWSFDVWCKHVSYTFLHRSGDLDSQQDLLWFPRSWTFRCSWLVGKVTANKMHLLGSDYQSELLEHWAQFRCQQGLQWQRCFIKLHQPYEFCSFLLRG